MSQFPDANLPTRRKLLVAQIARQRAELNEAYHDLAQPIHYAEYGLRSFGFLRKNPWVFTAVPAFFSVTGTVLGLFRGKSKSRAVAREIEREEKRPRSLAGHALKWGGRGFRLFKLYRKLKPFLAP